MAQEFDGRKGFGGVRDFELRRRPAAQQSGDDGIHGVEVNDQQRRAVEIREIARFR
jgi:hypothetical protein